MKVHIQVEGSPRKAAVHAGRIAALGADGVFTFEGPHDVFLPLVMAAGQPSLELMTNVAIAGPRSPLHLAHAAYDLQIYGGGRFRLGVGSQIKVHIEKRYGAQWVKPAAKMAETVAAVKAIFAAWEGGMSFHGGLIGVIIAILLFCRSRKLRLSSDFGVRSCAPKWIGR